ncbi:hypothetical protein AMAG_07395 [Allomyces macrogynus ATCC 38327]|uniref:Uncharacterized protein n=1 Tax=Allomyces macrogynus (strain ATCC 38327) TaxID=578462 RepID=A0A0L0SII6_ALLM3|nr:hypothetical protein AMAG_07395 [Allomyces macrogynus ATCC 38327]|eukprot:KNE62150.1 hypothetical protein AMAG_07395 [Allomyces macrogynus ATCC 38327]
MSATSAPAPRPHQGNGAANMTAHANAATMSRPTRTATTNTNASASTTTPATTGSAPRWSHTSFNPFRRAAAARSACTTGFHLCGANASTTSNATNRAPLVVDLPANRGTDQPVAPPSAAPPAAPPTRFMPAHQKRSLVSLQSTWKLAQPAVTPATSIHTPTAHPPVGSSSSSSTAAASTATPRANAADSIHDQIVALLKSAIEPGRPQQTEQQQQQTEPMGLTPPSPDLGPRLEPPGHDALAHEHRLDAENHDMAGSQDPMPPPRAHDTPAFKVPAVPVSRGFAQPAPTVPQPRTFAPPPVPTPPSSSSSSSLSFGSRAELARPGLSPIPESETPPASSPAPMSRDSSPELTYDQSYPSPATTKATRPAKRRRLDDTIDNDRRHDDDGDADDADHLVSAVARSVRAAKLSAQERNVLAARVRDLQQMVAAITQQKADLERAHLAVQDQAIDVATRATRELDAIKGAIGHDMAQLMREQHKVTHHLQALVDRLNKEKDEVVAQLAAAQGDARSLRERLDEAVVQLAVAQGDARSLQMQLDEARSGHTATVTALEERYQQAVATVAELQAQIAQHAQHVEQVHQIKQLLVDEHAKALAAVTEEGTKSHERLMQLIHDRDQELAAKQTALDHEHELRAAAEASLARVQAQLDGQQWHDEALASVQDALGDKFTAVMEALARGDHGVAEYHAAVTSQVSQIITQLQDPLTTISSTVGGTQSTLLEPLRRLETQLEAQQQTAAALAQQHRDSIRDLQDQLRAQQKQLCDRLRATADLQTELAATHTQLNDAIARKTALHAQLGEAHHEQHRLREEAAALRTANGDEKRRLDQQIAELSTKREAVIRRLQADAEVLARELAEMRAALEAKDAAMRAAEQAKDVEMRTALEAKDATVREIRAALEAKEAEMHAAVQAKEMEMDAAVRAKESEMQTAMQEAARASEQDKRTAIQTKDSEMQAIVAAMDAEVKAVRTQAAESEQTTIQRATQELEAARAAHAEELASVRAAHQQQQVQWTQEMATIKNAAEDLQRRAALELQAVVDGNELRMSQLEARLRDEHEKDAKRVVKNVKGELMIQHQREQMALQHKIRQLEETTRVQHADLAAKEALIQDIGSRAKQGMSSSTASALMPSTAAPHSAPSAGPLAGFAASLAATATTSTQPPALAPASGGESKTTHTPRRSSRTTASTAVKATASGHGRGGSAARGPKTTTTSAAGRGRGAVPAADHDPFAFDDIDDGAGVPPRARTLRKPPSITMAGGGRRTSGPPPRT